MRRAHHLAALPILLLCSQSVAAGPHPPNVNITWDQNIKFGKYHSYIWVPGRTPPAGENVADYERVRASIDRYLASRGFRKGPTGEFAIAVRATDAKPGYEGSGWGSVASLSIDIYDTATKHRIWNGIAKVEVSRLWNGIAKVEVRRRLSPHELDRAVERLLDRFPPSHGCFHGPAKTLKRTSFIGNVASDR
jgi:hypothetical protein